MQFNMSDCITVIPHVYVVFFLMWSVGNITNELQSIIVMWCYLINMFQCNLNGLFAL